VRGRYGSLIGRGAVALIRSLRPGRSGSGRRVGEVEAALDAVDTGLEVRLADVEPPYALQQHVFGWLGHGIRIARFRSPRDREKGVGSLCVWVSPQAGTVPGLYAAGEIVRAEHNNASLASSDGVTAGVALHQALVADAMQA
jgi:hypothetical protein